MRYLINFKVKTGEFFFENLLPRVEVVNIDNKVWENLPAGLISPMTDQDELYLGPDGELIGPFQAQALVNEINDQTKLFTFSLDENERLVEDPNGTIKQRLPLDVDIEQLEYINGEILLFVRDEGDK